jgi:hypothetical protein
VVWCVKLKVTKNCTRVCPHPRVNILIGPPRRCTTVESRIHYPRPRPAPITKARPVTPPIPPMRRCMGDAHGVPFADTLLDPTLSLADSLSRSLHFPFPLYISRRCYLPPLPIDPAPLCAAKYESSCALGLHGVLLYLTLEPLVALEPPRALKPLEFLSG